MSKCILFIVALFTLSSFAAKPANTLYPLATASQRTQFTHLLKELRCLVCQNQDLGDSNAPLAKDLREQVYLMVKEGKHNEEIIHYLTSRYGEFVLFKPAFTGVTLLLWVGPLLFLVIGLVILFRTCFKRNPHE